MNAYDFDKTIYDGDSTADFYLFALKRHKKILTLAPSLLAAFVRFYVFKKGTKTEFKEKMYRFLRFCDLEKDLEDFWKINQSKIKEFYIKQQRDDDVIISASPEFLLKPICKSLGIKHLIASRVDCKSGIYDGINCHGKEKVRRFYEELGENTKIYSFYSDSYSDTPMAELAENAFIVKKDKIIKWQF
jgi:HAD superfamily phosphoserine phosphatase-like hydrolase